MPKKKDEGHEETEAVLKDLEKRINKEYAQAEKELQAKVDDYMRRFKIKDDIKRNAVANGKLDKKKYQDWLTGQLAIGKRWEEMKDSIARDLTETAQIAKGIASGYMPDVYAINHNYGTFQVEKASKVDTSYTLYNRDAVNRMFKETDFYKKPGRKVQKAINEGKQMAWDKKQIQSIMFQGIVQGESVGQIATRICKQTCDSDRKAAIRNARTMTTGVQNAGRVDSYKRAEDMGIKLQQQWLATLDDRTRHEHRQLDGMRVAVGEQFHVDGEEKTYDIEYPGDPSADPEMVYNCRCTLVPVLEGFEHDASDRELRHDDHLGSMTYDEWKESHEERSDPITKQDDIAETMRNSYIQDYKYLAGQNPNIPNSDDYEPPHDIPHEEPTRFADIHADFTPAESIQDAEAFAKGFVDGGFNLTGKSVSYKGISLENANAINQRLADIYAQFDLDKLSSIEAFGKNNKKVYEKNADAPMATTNFGNLVLNNTILKDRKAIEKYISDGEDAFDYVLKNMDKLSGKQLEIAKAYETAGRTLVGDSIEDMVTHEIGHHISYMVSVNKSIAQIDGWEDYAKELSGYANHSKGEYIAEAFNAYYNGETKGIHPELANIFESLRRK